MSERLVGPEDSVAEGSLVVVDLGDVEVGVLKFRGEFRAFENRCPHQGGPICYGRMMGQQEGILDDERCLVGERLSAERFNLICPWHGWSFDVLSGENICDRHYRLKRWRVSVRDGFVYLEVPEGVRHGGARFADGDKG